MVGLSEEVAVATAGDEKECEDDQARYETHSSGGYKARAIAAGDARASRRHTPRQS
jgi:hypothetical protein